MKLGIVAAAFAIALAFACSGSPSGNDGGGGGTGGSGGSGGGCTIDGGTPSVTVSGAVSGTRTLNFSPVASWSKVNDITTFNDDSNGLVTTPFMAGYGFTFRGKPTAGASITPASLTVSPDEGGFVRAWISNTQNTWLAVRDIAGNTDQGTFTLTFNSVSCPTPVGSDLIWYEVHGTLTATLPADPQGTASGSTNATVTF